MTIDSKMLKPTIISISMATVMAGAAISPALGVIAQAFPEASSTLIKMILTMPAITIIPFTFLTSFLITKFTKRTIVLFGLSTYLIGGLGPQFMPTIELIILFRLILGASVGILMPLSESLIYDYYAGKERAQMMGYNAAFSNFGGIITMLVAGWLATIGWQLPFNVYLLGVLIFILVFFYLPKGEVTQAPLNETNSKIPLSVYGYSLAMGAVMLAYYAVATNMALYLEQTNLGGPALAGTIVSFAAVGGMTTSFFLVYVIELMKKYLIPAMLSAMGLSFLLISVTNHVSMVIIAVCFIGFAQGSLFPVLTMKALDRVKLHQTDRAIAIATTFIFTGQFISPMLLDFIGKFANQASIRFQYFALSVMILISVVNVLIFLHFRLGTKTVVGQKRG